MTAPIETPKIEREPEEIQPDHFESQEVDGEWGRQPFRFALLAIFG